MSFNVLVVPEDPSHNGYILKPLVVRMLAECGRGNAKVDVLTNPRAQGYAHAKELLRGALLERYRHKDLLLFLVDADGKDRRSEFLNLEEEAASRGVRLLCCAAEQEVEVWLLAGHRHRLDQGWQEVRAEVSVKERIFAPFLAAYGDRRRAGGGRDLLMKETLVNYGALLQLCPELAGLERRLRGDW
ncbi:MAG TPA: hypothetical protein VL025_03940 [Thermoanaerobaculia bacterium]|nr:hypothetical protein [Thermoanaerobaculia bacterium]